MYGLKSFMRPCVCKAEASRTTISVIGRPSSQSAGSCLDVKDDTTRVPAPLVSEGPLTDALSTHISSVIRRVTVDEANTLNNEILHDTKRAVTANGRPLSPFLDPAYIAANSRHIVPKAERSKTPTPFQQLLAKNIYAQALLTPVRHCAFTETWLPSYFLQDFELITHPKTGERWYLPRSLVRHPSTTPASSTHLKSEHSGDTDSKPHPKFGPGKYMLARQSLLAATNQRQSGFTHKWQQFLPPLRAKKYKAFDQGKLRWRADIDVFVLRLMRNRVVEQMKYLAGKKTYFVHCTDLENAMTIKRLGAILWFGEGSHVDTSPQSFSPGEFATLDTRREIESKIPVHNMRVLLGDSLAEELRQNYEVYQADLVGLYHRNVTVGLQLKLWKLQGYLAKLEQVTTSQETDSVTINSFRRPEEDEEAEDVNTPAHPENSERGFVGHLRTSIRH